MLAPLPKIAPEADEVSILISLFSQKDSNTSKQTSPYDIDHHSRYDTDLETNDESALLQRDLTDAERSTPTYYSKPTLYNVPTIWMCVKNAFVMPRQ
jgi:hypothetical protein